MYRSFLGKARELGRPSRIEPLESSLVVFGLVTVFQTFAGVLQRGANASGGRTESGGLLLILTTSLYALGLFLMTLGTPRWIGGVLQRSWPLLALIALCCLSFLWSDDRGTTFRRSLALVLTTSFAVYIVSRFSFEEFVRLFVISFAIYAGVMLLSILLGSGVTSGRLFTGAWQGFTGQKNNVGRTAGLAFVLLIVFLPRWPAQFRVLYGIIFPMIAVLILLKSTSKTPLLAAAVALCSIPIYNFLVSGKIGRFRIATDVRFAMFSTGLLAAVLVVFVIAPAVLEALGRDLTLSGRTKLWAWVANIAQNQPWLGAGYRAFWIDANTKYFFVSFAWQQSPDGTLSDSYAGPTHSHSSYMDTWDELGFIGVILLVIFLLSCLVRGARARGHRRFDPATTLGAVTVFSLVYFTAERAVLQHSEDLWFSMTLLYLYTSAQILELKQSKSINAYSRNNNSLAHSY